MSIVLFREHIMVMAFIVKSGIIHYYVLIWVFLFLIKRWLKSSCMRCVILIFKMISALKFYQIAVKARNSLSIFSNFEEHTLKFEDVRALRVCLPAVQRKSNEHLRPLYSAQGSQPHVHLESTGLWVCLYEVNLLRCEVLFNKRRVVSFNI